MKTNQIFLFLSLFIIVGAIAFYGGMKYQESNQRNNFLNNLKGGGAPGMLGRTTGQNGNRVGFRPVNGEIISTDDKSITVKMPDGSSRIVFINDKTIINNAETASREDLKLGVKVAVFGNMNTDGSMSAQNIQLNPINSRREN